MERMGLIYAIIAGLAGAAAWAAVSYITHFEAGVIAWGIGYVVGAAMLWGSKRSAGARSGLIAGVIAAASVASGKFAVVHLTYARMAQHSSSVTFNDDQLRRHMAEELLDEYDSQGKPLVWPPGKNARNADLPSDYPPDLWKELESRWAAMTPEQKTQYRHAAEAASRPTLPPATPGLEFRVFLRTFRGLDVLWFIFAVGTAFRMANGPSRGAVPGS